MGILQLISTSNFITVNKDLIKELGLEEAILLGELASEYEYWQKKDEIQDGYFYSTIENIEEKTILTAYKQRKCLENLKNKGIIDVQIKGIPAKRYIKIYEEQVIKIFNNKLLKNFTTRCEKISQLEVKKLNGNNNINNNINNSIKRETKNKYGEYKHVLLTQNEYNTLVSDYPNYNELITYLDEYIEMKGYKAKSHYLCIKKWVVDAVKRNQPKKQEMDWDEWVKKDG